MYVDQGQRHKTDRILTMGEEVKLIMTHYWLFAGVSLWVKRAPDSDKNIQNVVGLRCRGKYSTRLILLLFLKLDHCLIQSVFSSRLSASQDFSSKTLKRTRKFVIDGVEVSVTTSKIIKDDEKKDEEMRFLRCVRSREQTLNRRAVRSLSVSLSFPPLSRERTPICFHSL